jgi:hypothetical protein
VLASVGYSADEITRFVEDGAVAEDGLEHAARGLAGTEARHARSAGKGAGRLADGRGQALGRDLDLDDDRALGGGGGRDLHRREG